MSYDARERSVHDGSPVELYEFRRNAATWRHTSQAVDYDLDGVIYSALPMQRSSVEATQDLERLALKVRVPRDAEVAQNFVAIPPSTVMLLTVRRIHRGDDEPVVVWMGRVLNADWREAECEFNCEPVHTSLRRSGLRRFYGRNCPHALYDSSCLASPAAHRTPGNVSAINDSTITVPQAAGVPDGRLRGGYASWTSAGGGAEQRTILNNSGTSVELLAPPFGLEVGDAIDLHDGCRHTIADCDANFGNADNYGGFPNIPTRNPFDSTGPTY